jgi:hypothetical protein
MISSMAESLSAGQEVPCLLQNTVSSPCSQELIICYYPETDESTHTLMFCLFKVHFSIVLLSMSRSSKWSLHIFSMKTLCASLICLTCATCPSHLILLNSIISLTGKLWGLYSILIWNMNQNENYNEVYFESEQFFKWKPLKKHLSGMI